MGKKLRGTITGREYEITQRIGEGAQGAVFATTDPGYAIKLIATKREGDRQRLGRRISFLQARDLDKRSFSKPIEVLEGTDKLAYVLQIARDMEPITSLLNREGKNWWQKTGGLERRLTLLRNLARILSQLHGRGLVYGDLSDANVFVSKDMRYNHVFLIDVDNVTFQSKAGEGVYTPGYGDPEIIKKVRGSDFASDSFAFAILSYRLLTLTHPFVGDFVNEGDPELEEQAYLGELPWVGHTSDRTNSCTSGLPPDLTISPKMMSAFQRTFEGNRFQRVRMQEWREILDKVLDATIECQYCDETFYFNKDLKCTFCGETQEAINYLSFHPFLKPLIKEFEQDFDLQLKSSKEIGKPLYRVFFEKDSVATVYEKDLYLGNSDIPLFDIEVKDDHVIISGREWKTISVLTNGQIKPDVPIVKPLKASLKDWFILSKKDDEYQRVMKVNRLLG